MSIVEIDWGRAKTVWMQRPLWHFLLLAAAVLLAIFNAAGVVQTFGHFDNWGIRGDWAVLASVDPSSPYQTGPYRWAPPAIWLWQPVVGIGFWAWAALHLAALGLVRPWWVAALVGVSWPFWEDVANGNVLTFVFVAAWLALRGNRSGVILYVFLFALMPRPVMVPVAAWLLWHRSDARWALGLGAILVLGTSVIVGQTDDWIVRLISSGGAEIASPFNIGPTAWIGAAWLPLGIALAAVLTLKGRLGLASMAASPYWLAYYGVFLALEFRDRDLERGRSRAASTSARRLARSIE